MHQKPYLTKDNKAQKWSTKTQNLNYELRVVTADFRLFCLKLQQFTAICSNGVSYGAICFIGQVNFQSMEGIGTCYIYSFGGRSSRLLSTLSTAWRLSSSKLDWVIVKLLLMSIKLASYRASACDVTLNDPWRISNVIKLDEIRLTTFDRSKIV